jgi:glycosyltransferase involved in cell wall biosynthesis
LSPSTKAPSAPPTVDLVIPVLNERRVLEASTETVRAYLREKTGYRGTVVIVDNGSTDGTKEIGERLAATYEDVRFLHLAERGRGRALRRAWTESEADVCAYTDVDLSTDLRHLNQLVDGILYEGFDLATGSRLLSASEVKRGPKREFISRAYNAFVKLALGTKFSDAQCGFKAAGRRVIEAVVPQVADQGWFFDTELLTLAERQGFKIKDVPVRWVDDDDSRVKIVKTAWDDVKGVLRVRRTLKRAARSGAPIPVNHGLNATTS